MTSLCTAILSGSTVLAGPNLLLFQIDVLWATPSQINEVSSTESLPMIHDAI